MQRNQLTLPRQISKRIGNLLQYEEEQKERRKKKIKNKTLQGGPYYAEHET